MQQGEVKSEKQSEESVPNPVTVSLKLFFTEVAMISLFAVRYVKELFKPPYEFKEVVKQMYLSGYKSLALVGITGFIMGLVLTIQSKPIMSEFGAEAWIPGMVAVSIVREIGPVITSLICAGKVGSGMGAELGSMKVTEQIDAMEVSGTNPFKYLVITRVMATTFMLPVLVILGDAISLYGSYLGVNIRGNTSFQLYWSQIFDNLSFEDVIPAFIKSFFFGLVVGLVGCYKGFTTNKGTEGVGLSANSAVVLSSVLIFLVDLLAVQITDVLGFT